MEPNPLIEDKREIAPYERQRTALLAGSLFAGGLALALFLLAFPKLKTFNDLANVVALVLCVVVPAFVMVTFGMYVQLGYHNMYLRLARRLEDRPANRTNEPPP